MPCNTCLQQLRNLHLGTCDSSSAAAAAAAAVQETQKAAYMVLLQCVSE